MEHPLPESAWRAMRPMAALTGLIAACAISMLAMAPARSMAETPRWKVERYRYAVEGKPLREVMRDFASSQGMALSMSDDLQGQVAGKFDFRADRFIELMANAYGFAWYFDGAVLHVVSAKDIETRVLDLSLSGPDALREALGRLGVEDARFPLRGDQATRTAVVSGPVAYVRLVEEIALRLERPASHASAVVRVFPLRHQQAADRPAASEREPALPGLVSVLRGVHGQGGPGGQARDASMERGTLALERIAGPIQVEALGALGRQESQAGSARAEARPRDAVRPTPGRGALPRPARAEDDAEALPSFVADTRTNAVVVRDVPQRMDAHAALIAELDRVERQVQIEVRIIEVREDALEELGVDWRARGRRVDVAVDGRQDPGGAITAIVGDGQSRLLARIRALSQNGRARVVSSPRVVTLNHQQAVMAYQRTMHVKVAGRQSAQLYAVQAGTQLRVTPAAAGEGEGTAIRLDVGIEDGSFLMDQMVDGLPLVSRSRIDTQARLAPGQSLLVAGHASEYEQAGQSRVPWLGSLPLVGGLFRVERTERGSFARMFLVTPTLIP